MKGESLDLGLRHEPFPDELILGGVVEDPAVTFLRLLRKRRRVMRECGRKVQEERWYKEGRCEGYLDNKECSFIYKVLVIGHTS